jgi:hypothetical protein
LGARFGEDAGGSRAVDAGGQMQGRSAITGDDHGIGAALHAAGGHSWPLGLASGRCIYNPIDLT